MTKFNFPKNFLWGAATAAHQVEGGQHNNWTEWENDHIQEWINEARRRYRSLPTWERFKDDIGNEDNYRSGQAADHYNRYPEDIEIMKSIGLNSYRFSVEWSRIEPEPGRFDAEQIAHYRRVLKRLKQAGITPFVSLHHFTDPVWLEEFGGWHGKDFPAIFARFVEHVVGELGDLVEYWTTINEPESYLISRYLGSPVWPGWPHQETSYLKYMRARRGFVRAHKRAYETIKRHNPEAQVGFAHGVVLFEPKHWWIKPLTAWLDWDGGTGKYRHIKNHQDFLALQYYMRNFVTVKLRNLTDWAEMPQAERMSDFGWEVYPEGLYILTQRLKKYGLPIYITENGVADSQDRLRADFIRDHLEALNRSLADGADIRGYFYWSLLDNYEWSSGFWPQFGLVEIDRATQERKVRPSAKVYAELIEKYSN